MNSNFFFYDLWFYRWEDQNGKDSEIYAKPVKACAKEANEKVREQR